MPYTPDPAATYTTNYTLEKPSHGSHDGTWELWIASAFDTIDAAIAAAAASGGTIDQIKMQGYTAGTIEIPAFSVLHCPNPGQTSQTMQAFSLCDSSSSTGWQGVIGINLVALAPPSGNPVATAIPQEVVIEGIVTNPSWNLVVGHSYSFNNAGEPHIAGYAFPRIIGYAITPTQLFLSPNGVADLPIGQSTIWTAKGQILAAWNANNAGALAVGANGQVLTADAAQAQGVKWATPATDAATLQTHPASDFALAAKGVTNGDSHDHNGGDGGQIAYANVSGTPTSLTPTAHSTTHTTGQADALTAANIGAEPAITTLPISKGGTGTGTAPTAGQVLIGTTAGGFTPAGLTAGANVTITPVSGGITIAATLGGGAGTGDVVGPSSATDNAIARFDSTTGKLIQNSGATLSDTGVLNLPTGGGVTVNGVALGGGAGGDAATLQTHPASDFALITALGTAAAKNVPATGDAASTEVVLGADTRMTNARAPTAHNHDAAYAPIAKGVTNGDSHDHNGGDGGQIAFGSLSGAPTSMAPTAHKATHATGQADAITPGNIGAEPGITTLPISKGGTGITTAPGNGKLLIGKTDGSYASATLTAGTNVTITNADGTITIAATGGSGAGVSRLAAITSAISILTSDAGAGKSGTIDLTATTGQIERIRLRADFLAGQQPTPGTFQVNNAAGISVTATTIAYDTVSAGMVLSTGGGDIIQIDGERILTATGTTTTSIAVATRGYNGTVATYHDDNAVGFKCSDGLRLELYPNSNYLPTERLLTLRNLMTGQWLVGAAGVTNGASFVPLTTSPAVISDFGAGSLIAILDTATDYARVQDLYGLVADSGTVNSIRTQTVRPAHAASVPIQRVLDYDLPVPFAFASGTSLYYKLFIDEKYTATVTVNVELIVDKYT